MKPSALWLGVLLLAGCAQLGVTRPADEAPRELWNEAHLALSVADFERATAAFERLARDHPESVPGRESLFYLGAIHLDPRNPEWDPAPAQAVLERYLASTEAAAELPRRPEAQTLLQLARQLNLPPEERVPALQAETTRVVTERVVVPARESRALAEEVDRLRRQLAERDTTIQRQREELERIRKTLTGTGSRTP